MKQKIINGDLNFDDNSMEYIRFGTGGKKLILLPGLGDGLHTVKGMALPMAVLYRAFAKEYTVYSFSRMERIPQGHSTRDMAGDLKRAMDMLGIEKADIMGVSMGGMIVQHLAADYPEAVGKLVLVVTIPCQNPVITGAVSKWMQLAERGEHRALMESNLKLIYSEKYYRKYRRLIPIIAAITNPKSYERFLRQAQACLTHNSLESLQNIKAPTLIIGGGKDETVGSEGSIELHSKIENSLLRIYPNGPHGLYEEEDDFQLYVLSFLKYKSNNEV